MLFNTAFNDAFTERVGAAVKLWNLIRKMLGSNLGRDTAYPDLQFSWFSSVSAGKFWDRTLIRQRPFFIDATKFGY
jgi:hypothetical protein